MDCSFPSFLNIYLFLFNTKLIVRVEFIDICHLLFELFFLNEALWDLTGSVGVNDLEVIVYAGKDLF